MNVSMSRSRGAIAVLIVLAAIAGGCEGHTSIPNGAQQIHVTVVGGAVRLSPATARAGDIYLVMGTPGTDVVLVQKKTTADGPLEPLTDADLDRIAHGDTQFTAITGGFANGEPHGYVTKIVLTPGRYALLIDSPEVLAPQLGGVIPADSIAILEIQP